MESHDKGVMQLGCTGVANVNQFDEDMRANASNLDAKWTFCEDGERYVRGRCCNRGRGKQLDPSEQDPWG